MNTTVSYPTDRQYIALCMRLVVFRLPTFVVCRVYFLSKFVRYLPRFGIVAPLRLDNCFFVYQMCLSANGASCL